MRITFVSNSLGGGGAERALINLASGFSDDGDVVTIITISREPDDAYPVPGGVERMALDLGGDGSLAQKIERSLRRFIALRRTIIETEPDVVISFQDVTNVTTLIALVGAQVPVIVSEHNDPVTQPIRSRLWGMLRRVMYPRAERLVSVSNGIDTFFEWMPPEKRAIIPNPLPTMPLPSAQGNSDQIIAAGRLIPQKGFDLLIDAFAQIAAEYPNWRLVILGEGELRPALEEQIAHLGLEARIELPGFVNSPFDWLVDSDFFVLSSRSEGFGNVIIEAMACGLPIISFDCPTGPRDIITHEQDGLLVGPGDIDALAAAMRWLIDSPVERSRLGKAAVQTSQRYVLPNIMQNWRDLLLGF